MDGIIFDVDGTLWDSTDVVATAYNETIAAFTDLPTRVMPDDLKKLFGKPMDVIFATLLPSLPYEEQCRLAKECFAREHVELEKTPGTLYAGIGDTLTELYARYPLFIVSNCQDGYIDLFLRKTGFGPLITDHLCFGQTGLPKGQTLLRLMQRNGLTAPVYVGDTQGDADACKEAGIPFVHAAYGFGDADSCDYRIQSFAELISLFP